MNKETLEQQEKAKAIVKDRRDVKKQIQKYIETVASKTPDYVSKLECLGDFAKKARLLEESDCTFVKNTRMLLDVANGYFWKGMDGEALSEKQGFEELKSDLFKEIYAEIELLAVLRKIEKFLNL